jgi:hypothetical protein
VGSTTKEPAHCCVRQALIGLLQRGHLPLYCWLSQLIYNAKRTKEKLRTGQMQIRGDQWPLFLYADLAYDPDDPWNGLLRNQLLITVSSPVSDSEISQPLLQAFKHVFTSPSSVDEDEPKATKAGNAYIHGMRRVTKASLAYIATQVVSFHRYHPTLLMLS